MVTLPNQLNNYSLGWYKISYDGKEGWVWGNYIAYLNHREYATIKDVYQLNIRSNPSSTAQIVGY